MYEPVKLTNLRTIQSSPIESQLCILAASDYFRSFVERVRRAQRRVSIVVLLIGYDHETKALFEELYRALARGVEVSIAMDGYYTRTYYLGRGVVYRNTLAALAGLQRDGASIYMRERSSINPLKGRCHIKFSVVDDTVFGFGGVNLAEKAARNVDYMWESKDARLADWLCQIGKEIALDGPCSNQSLVMNDGTQILVDGGTPGQSIIYGRACEMVKRARYVYYVSQFCPTGPLARLLHDRATAYYFNRSAKAGIHLGAMLTVDKVISGGRTAYARPEYLHAKFLLAELNDGTRALISGSHNYKNHGVRYGTMEIAAYSTNLQLWEQMYSYLVSDVAIPIGTRI